MKTEKVSGMQSGLGFPPGQCSVLQSTLSSRFEQGVPPSIGHCVTTLRLVVIPPPQVFEQLLHSLHPPISQSTGIAFGIWLNLENLYA